MPAAMDEHSPVGYNRTALFSIGKLVTAQSGRPIPIVMETIKQLGILKNKRGKRGGKNYIKRTWDHNQGTNEKNLKTLPQEIPCIVNTKTKPCMSRNTQNLNNIVQIKCETLQIHCGGKNLKICSLNPRSVKNKTVALSDFILSNDFDIVAITETWLVSSVDKICVGELVPGGYRMQHVPRQNNMRGGGVATIYKSSIELRVIASTRDGDFNIFEFMDCNIVLKHFSLRLTVIYRPPPSKKKKKRP